MAPAGTVTVAGTVATSPLPLARVTTTPPVGAELLTVTVPVEVPPPEMMVGLRVSVESVGAVTCERRRPRARAQPRRHGHRRVGGHRDAGRREGGGGGSAATVTLAGTLAAVLPLARVTVSPPEGAAPFRVTVPVEEAPPTTAVGLRASGRASAPSP